MQIVSKEGAAGEIGCASENTVAPHHFLWESRLKTPSVLCKAARGATSEMKNERNTTDQEVDYGKLFESFLHLYCPNMVYTDVRIDV